MLIRTILLLLCAFYVASECSAYKYNYIKTPLWVTIVSKVLDTIVSLPPLYPQKDLAWGHFMYPIHAGIMERMSQEDLMEMMKYHGKWYKEMQERKSLSEYFDDFLQYFRPLMTILSVDVEGIRMLFCCEGDSCRYPYGIDADGRRFEVVKRNNIWFRLFSRVVDVIDGELKSWGNYIVDYLQNVRSQMTLSPVDVEGSGMLFHRRRGLDDLLSGVDDDGSGEIFNRGRAMDDFPLGDDAEGMRKTFHREKALDIPSSSDDEAIRMIFGGEGALDTSSVNRPNRTEASGIVNEDVFVMLKYEYFTDDM